MISIPAIHCQRITPLLKDKQTKAKKDNINGFLPIYGEEMKADWDK